MENAGKNRIKLLLLLLFGMYLSLKLLQITVQNELVPMDSYYELLQTTIENVRRENILLNEQILRSESLTVIAEKAKQMGFIPAQ